MTVDRRLSLSANNGQPCAGYKSRCSSGVEHFLGKEEVVSSILINGSDSFLKRILKDALIEQSRSCGKVVSSILINGSDSFLKRILKDALIEQSRSCGKVVSSI